jgi:hypothetical protein
VTRPPNAVDFWRGFALITIFIDHIPGLFYSHYTLVNYSIADAADLFVFLAGWSLRLMADGGGRSMPTRDVMLRKRAERHRRHHDQSRRFRRTGRQCRDPHEERSRARGARPGALAGRHQ